MRNKSSALAITRARQRVPDLILFHLKRELQEFGRFGGQGYAITAGDFFEHPINSVIERDINAPFVGRHTCFRV